MKKILTLMLAGCMVFSLAACGGAPAASSAASSDAGVASSLPETAESTPVAPVGDGTYELAMITDIGTIDDRSFNQGTWEGVKKYGEEKSLTHQYYKPTEQSDDAYLSAIELAVKGGAKVIVTPGFLFEPAIGAAQTQYPDVSFILVDGFPRNAEGAATTEKNTVGVIYAEEQAGFLAGYAAVKEGFTSLGFIGGMAVPAVVRYGYGFVQGAEFAAAELGLADGAVKVKYNYAGGFSPTPEAQALAASWYQDGTEVIFACAGGLGNSVMAAAEAAGAKVIGVDVDQSADSETVITSSTKFLGDTVYALLDQLYNGSFPGGSNLTYTAKDKMLGLPMDTSKFEKFTAADYDAIYKKLESDEGGISTNLVKDADASGNQIAVTDIPVKTVALTEVK